MLKVGDKVWKIDVTARSERQIREHQIVGETRVSWLVDYYGRTAKMPKKYDARRDGPDERVRTESTAYGRVRWFVNREGVEDHVWMYERARGLREKVESVLGSDDPRLLRELDTLLDGLGKKGA